VSSGTSASNERRALIVALIVLGLGAFITALVILPIDTWIVAAVTEIRGLGAAGALLFALFYIVATVLALPGSILTLAAGFAYGPLVGVAIVSPAAVIGASLAFLVARHLLRERVARRIAESPRLSAVDAAVGEQGAVVVFLLRLSPVIPFNALNYALGLTRVSLPVYALASWIGMLPGAFLYTYLGSTLSALGETAAGEAASTPQLILFWGGLAATVAVTVLVTRAARRALARRVSLPRPADEEVAA